MTPQNVHKLASIALTMLFIARHHAKSNEMMQEAVSQQIRLILKNCELANNELIMRISSEAHVFLEVPKVLSKSGDGLQLLLNELEISLHKQQV